MTRRLVGAHMQEPVAVPNPAILGDVLTSTWSHDGELFSVMDDTWPFDSCPAGSNVSVHRVLGGIAGSTAEPHAVAIEPLNCLADYGGQGDGWDQAETQFSSWKGSGILEVDDRLFLSVSRHLHGPPPPPDGPGGFEGYELSYDASVVCSEDGGHTWRNHQGVVSAAGAAPDLGQAMFPGDRFCNPYFIHARDLALPSQAGGDAGLDRHIYATSTAWSLNNASQVYLGRVERTRLPELRADDWTFFAGFDDGSPRWGELASATPTLDTNGTPLEGRLGMAGIVRIRHEELDIDRYLFPQWNWPKAGRPITHVEQFREMMSQSEWLLLEAGQPWGPWEVVPLDGAPSRIWPQCFYTPTIPTKFISPDAASLTIFAAGIGDIDPATFASPHYRLHTFKVELSWSD